jgi:error-prone DNA polymerase
VVLVRQRPGSAKGVCFMTLEDETGTVNVVIWPKLFKANRPVAMGARLLLIRGRIQRAEGVVHLVADSLEDRSADLASLSQSSAARPSPHASGHRHPRDVRILPRSRDFH